MLPSSFQALPDIELYWLFSFFQGQLYRQLEWLSSAFQHYEHSNFCCTLWLDSVPFLYAHYSTVYGKPSVFVSKKASYIHVDLCMHVDRGQVHVI